jgi:hypothetical protein
MRNRDLVGLGAILRERGFKDTVEYNEGGWQDFELKVVQPHLKFVDEDDAIAFILTYGGQVSKELPIR